MIVVKETSSGESHLLLLARMTMMIMVMGDDEDMTTGKKW